jgi:hypothetical protein
MHLSIGVIKRKSLLLQKSLKFSVNAIQACLIAIPIPDATDLFNRLGTEWSNGQRIRFKGSVQGVGSRGQSP